jgi:hypothetical protein
VLEATCAGTETVSLDATAPPPPPPAPPAPGSVTVRAQLPAVGSFSTVRCELQAPGEILLTESLAVNGPSLNFTLENVPAGMDDTLALTMTSTDGTETCSASSTFDVLAQQTTATALLFQCTPVTGDW